MLSNHFARKLTAIALALLPIALRAQGSASEVQIRGTTSQSDLLRYLHDRHDNVVSHAVGELLVRANSNPEAIVRDLTNVLAEPNPKATKLHEWAAYAIGSIQVGDADTVHALLRLVDEGCLGINDADAPANAAWAIGRIGYIPDKDAVLKALIRALKEGYGHLREEAAFALGALASSFEGAQADVAVNSLRTALELDASPRERLRDVRIRTTAAEALGRFALTADSALPDLVQTSLQTTSESQEVLFNAVLKSITEIVIAVRETADLALATQLDDDRRKLIARYRGSRSFLLTNALNAMEKTSAAIKEHSLSYQLISHWYWSVPGLLVGIYLLWFLVLRFVLLRRWPIAVLHLFEAIPNVDFKIPKLEVQVPLRGLVTTWSHYSERVLDAWVITARDEARNQIDHLSERDQSFYIPLPVELNGSVLPELGVADLQNHCTGKSWTVAIVGDGGLGKTTLAYQLARWSISDSSPRRLSNHLSIPVFLELDYSADTLTYVEIEAEIQRQLKMFSKAVRMPSAEFCRALTSSRRVVVILDNVSELLQAKLSPALDENVNALICTSRTAGRLSRHPAALIRPRYIENRNLFRLVDHYLERYEKELTIIEVAAVAEQLRVVLSKTRRCTPLLANIFAQHLVNFANGAETQDDVPAIPDLFVGYVRFLNRDRRDFDNESVYAAAALAAWKCVEELYLPTSASKSELRNALSAAQMDIRLLDHLVQLGIIREVKANGRFVFSIDTAAEYLAADYMLGSIRNEEEWRNHVDSMRTAPGGPERIRGLLCAVRDNLANRPKSAKTPFSATRMLADIDALTHRQTADPDQMHARSATA